MQSSSNSNNPNLRRSSRLQQQGISPITSTPSSQNNANTRSSSKKSKQSSAYTPKPPKRSKRKSIGRRYKRKSTTYGQGNGSIESPYFSDIRAGQYTKKKQNQQEHWPQQKQMRKLKKIINNQQIIIEEQEQIQAALSSSLSSQETVTNQIIKVLNDYENKNIKMNKKIKYQNKQIQELLSDLEKYKYIDNDDEVYIEVADINDDDHDNEEEINLFGVQAGALKKYKRYNIKIIAMCIELCTKTTPNHIPLIIQNVLQTYGYHSPSIRIPSPNTIRFDNIYNLNIIMI